MMNGRRFVLASGSVALLLLAVGVTAAQEKKLPTYCPPPGTIVSLGKAMNSSFLKDFKDCDIVVAATFLKMGTPPAFKLGGYDEKKNTVFQVLEPGGVPQSAFGQTFGTFAGTPKERSDILFQLKPGDELLLRGAPRSSRGGPVFHADSVTRKP